MSVVSISHPVTIRSPVERPAFPVAVRIDRLSRSFAGRTVLNDVSLEVTAGEFVALIGRSGCGKSTLLRALASLDDDADGDGELAVPENVSVLFQDARLLPWESVVTNVGLGLDVVPRKELAERSLKALSDVGLSARADAWPGTLSGGEAQRVALARSLARQPALLLADEPFGALDALTRLRMQDLLLKLVSEQRPTVLLVTHDVEEALVLADRVLVMDSGQIINEVRVSLPRPRRRSEKAFEEMRERLLSALGVDQFH
ncbi:ABC transporter ATP-binding protein [Rhizobium sp. VS19-DR104.2]|uniref:ABC transporter ATP-binding protein n=1 Tax=unclassified Rhizobium TaxID=2613769 RepID=UPI001CC5D856|nr:MULTISPECIES: ABC transporter ATP-binding protein [unclassified Rhizobium]MBZ5763291.1 ABC transporter ATP-binding protein [Rhizobium sp. VS19-DR96]MBZ5769205.1 ABC transporter ATP-binding protein [Rhizobium sp. VS19-DR129.2]MBZ5776732.1 ABC transporter ATP-binding protein [Rhizobium sp. VS19-DRK62.2]MBZ5787928.1 ABC transporter ATP-binding protein [Rhizobium sp. VS19-DR121]MBZ5805368.1 ABC transporter ATP-binding protein [Rhizobium sp. VS19-DR181]